MFPIGTTRPTSRPKAFLLIKDVHVYEWLDIFSLISAAAEVYSERAPPSPLSRVVCRGGFSSTEDDDDNEVTVI
jgi:hypothetical protein